MKPKILAVIPARYASTRFPAKPLADIGGKTMIQRTWEQVCKARLVDDVIVATDHYEIFDHCESFGASVIMTAEHHPSGTDRCYEVLRSMGEKPDFVLNVQGDEPFIQPEQIDTLAELVYEPNLTLGTLVKVIKTYEELLSPGTAKVVLDIDNHAIYFSRQPIPFLRNFEPETWLDNHTFYKHIGMYLYSADALRDVFKLPLGNLEAVESLEQLRWLENGFKIKTAITELEAHSVDYPQDIEKLKQYWA